MKSVTKVVIIFTCIFLIGFLLYPPWEDKFSGKFLGFYFITGEDIDEIYYAQIDYKKLIMIMSCVGSGIMAVYLSLTIGIFNYVARLFIKIINLFTSSWNWLGKNWLWLVLASMFIKIYDSIPEYRSYIQKASNHSEHSEIHETNIPTRFGTLKIDHKYELLYNNYSLTPEIRGNSSLSVIDVYTLEDSDAVLIQNNGGSACPAVFYFITTSDEGVKATTEFGTCTDIIDVKQEQNTIFVAMHGFRGPFEPLRGKLKALEEEHTFVYNDGIITCVIPSDCPNSLKD